LVLRQELELYPRFTAQHSGTINDLLIATQNGGAVVGNARVSHRIVTGLSFLFASSFATVHASPLTIVPTVAGLFPGIDQENFDQSALPSLTLGSNAGLVSGLEAGLYAAPYFSGSDPTQYVETLGGSTASFSFGGSQNHSDILWGSVGEFSPPAFAGSSNGVISSMSLFAFTEVIAGNSASLFEFYDIVYSVNPEVGSVPVPIPAGLWLTLAGLAGVWLLGWKAPARRQRFDWHATSAASGTQLA
jgi:hypothetical protein